MVEELGTAMYQAIYGVYMEPGNQSLARYIPVHTVSASVQLHYNIKTLRTLLRCWPLKCITSHKQRLEQSCHDNCVQYATAASTSQASQFGDQQCIPVFMLSL